MQQDKTNRLIYSASDLVNFTLCPAITLYDMQHLETPLEKAKEDTPPDSAITEYEQALAPMISTSLKPGSDSSPVFMMPAPSPVSRKPN